MIRRYLNFLIVSILAGTAIIFALLWAFGAELNFDVWQMHADRIGFHFWCTFYRWNRATPHAAFMRASFQNNFATYEWVATWWKLITLSLAIPLVQLNRTWQSMKLKRQHGLCATCGYDLRATPERCPECGGVVPEA